MVTVLFDEIDSYSDLGLFLSEAKITEPVPKRTTVEVPCRDGVLDLSYALSRTLHYKNRQLVLTFKVVDYTNDWDTVFSNIAGQLHGKQMRVSFSNHETWYYDCFVTVDPESEYNVGTIEVVCDAYPYKQSEWFGMTTATTEGSPMTVQVTQKPVVPTIICDNAITVKVDNRTEEYSLSAGFHEDPGFKLTAGNHTLLFKGSGDVSVNFTNGRL